MKDLLNQTYYSVGLGDACFAKLTADGHADRLGFFQQQCVCRLSPLCTFVGYTLTDEQQRMYDVFEKQIFDDIKQDEVSKRFSAENLPEIVGVSVSYLLIFVVGLVGEFRSPVSTTVH